VTFQVASVSSEGMALPLLNTKVPAGAGRDDGHTEYASMSIAKGMSLSGAAVSSSTAYDFGAFVYLQPGCHSLIYTIPFCCLLHVSLPLIPHSPF
jgi:hypothetical protein